MYWGDEGDASFAAWSRGKGEPVVAQGWVMKRCFLPAVLFLTFLPVVVSAHSIAELVKAPATFDQQMVSVTGEVANIVTRYGDTVYTTFDLLDEESTAVPVFIWGKPAFEQGDLCRVTGTFVLDKTVGTHTLTRGVEAEKVERVSEAEYKTPGLLFRKKRRAGAGAGGKYPRGFLFPH